MKFRIIRPRQLVLAMAISMAVVAGISANVIFAHFSTYQDNPDIWADIDSHISLTNTASARYIIRFAEQPLASYNDAVASGASKSINNIASIPFKTMRNGRNRLDVRSVQAQAYVQYLQQQQMQHLSDISFALGRVVNPVGKTMRHALNAAVIDLSPTEAVQVAKVDGVVAVTRDFSHALATDIGPGFIGAASLWWGTPAGQDSVFASGFDNNGGYRGDGIVIGDIDTGYNSASPSFQATDASGYTIQNPLGHDNFIGQCGVTHISTAGCNDKVIGVYDFIDDGSLSAPYSVEDTQGHGSHTASTAAGNDRSATVMSYTAPISGVAPHANLVIYYACAPAPVSCPNSATTSAVDQAIEDGIVDALNFSIGGGTLPWNDPTSLAFLAAANAGIFVAAAAGNGTQTPGTTNHAEPWVTTVAASTHTGGAIVPNLDITGPGIVPADIQSIILTEGTGDTPPGAPISASIILSPTFENTDTHGDDGCAAFTPNLFLHSIALLSRGTCALSAKATNAVNAGAIAVVIADNVGEAGAFSLSVTGAGATVPVYSILQSDGTNLQSFLTGAPDSTGSAIIPYPLARAPQQPDELANFSLLGPVNIDVIKPDVQAPGVDILAAIASDGSLQGPNLVGIRNGTSMAAPHTTGSGALLLGLHPDWTALEAKSALMMTAKEAGLTKADGVTASDYFDRGSGRLQDFPANNAGLVLDETGLNFTNANPENGGNPTTLNLASMQSSACVLACSFTRTFRSTQDHTVTWTATVSGDVSLSVNITPTSFPVVAHAKRPILFHVNSSALTSDGNFHYAEVVLTPSDATLPALHLPLAIAVPPPTIAASPLPVSIALAGLASGNTALTVFNHGGPTLNVTQTTAGTASYVWSNQPSDKVFGYTSTQYTGRVGNDSDSFGADDFTITGNSSIDLTEIIVTGFTLKTTLSSFPPTTMVHWRIYTDASGNPSSDPDTGGPTAFSYDAQTNATGVNVTGDTISLNLTAAGLHTALPAGHYWLVVYPTLPCSDTGSGCTEGWDWLTSMTGSVSAPVTIAPQSMPSQPWTAINASTGTGIAMQLESQISCVPPAWLSVTGVPVGIPGVSSAPLSVIATDPLGAPSVTSYLCLGSNDPVTPVLPVQVNATP